MVKCTCVFCLLFWNILLSHGQINCGHAAFLKNALQNDSIAQAAYGDMEEEALLYFRKKSASTSAENKATLRTIPVVVHILHQNGAENITDAQVRQAIRWLNEGFSKSGPYANAEGANTEIQFCLATRDPQGNASNGIVRVETPYTTLNWLQDASAKSQSYWPAQDYLNIWVVREICRSSVNCDISAYASVPFFHGGNNDGIVIESTFMGSTSERTVALIHEAGHYLGLYHTFEGGCTNGNCLTDGDRVCDTPPDQSTAGIPCGQSVNSCTTDAQSGFSADAPDDTRNFMDYGNLTCFQKFTAGQTARMRFFMEGQRASLLSSKGCMPPCPAAAFAAFFPRDTTIEPGTTLMFQNNSQNAASVVWSVQGQPAGNGPTMAYTFAQPGIYTVSLRAVTGTPAVCVDAEKSHIIQVVCPVRADFRLDPPEPVRGQPVQVISLAQNATQTEWFINGISQGSTLTSFIPGQAPFYTVRLVAKNALCTREKTLTFSLASECERSFFQKIIRTTEPVKAVATITLEDDHFVVGGAIGTTPAKILFVKADEHGVPVWSRVVSNDRGVYLDDMEATRDSGFVVCGRVTEPDGVEHAFLAKYNRVGIPEWMRKAPAPKGSRFKKIISLYNGTFLVTGWINTAKKNGCLVKFNERGDVIWQRLYAADTGMELSGILQDNTSNNLKALYICGTIQNRFKPGDTDGLFLYLDSLGNYSSLSQAQAIDIVESGISGEHTDITPPFAFGKNYGSFKNAQGQTKIWVQNAIIAYALDLSNPALEAEDVEYTNYYSAGTEHVMTGRTKGKTSGAFIQFGGQLNIAQYPGIQSFDDVSFIKDQLLVAGTIEKEGKEQIIWIRTDRSGKVRACPPEYPVSVLQEKQVASESRTITITQSAMPFMTTNDPLPVESGNVVVEEGCPQGLSCDSGPCKGSWIKATGVTNPAIVEGISCLIAAPDGTLAGTGFRRDSLLLFSMATDGSFLWWKAIPTAGRNYRPSSLIIDGDGHWVISGNYRLAAEYTFVIKYDPAAEAVLWHKISGTQIGDAVVEESPGDGHYVLSGTGRLNNNTAQAPVLLKLNRSTGEVVAGNSWMGAETDRTVITQIKNDASTLWAMGRSDTLPFIARVSANNRLTTLNQFLSQNLITGRVEDAVFDHDTALLLIALDPDVQGARSFGLLKMLPDGTPLWAFRYDHAPAIGSILYRQMERTKDGGVVLLVTDEKNASSSQIYLHRIDRNGNMKWSRTVARARYSFYGKNHLAVVGNSIFLAMEHTDLNSFYFIKTDLETGRIADTNCALVNSGPAAARFSESVVLFNRSVHPSGHTSGWTNGSLSLNNSWAGLEGYPCAAPCIEICDNDQNDDYTPAYDCFDPACRCPTPCHGEYANIWYFGKNAGLDFSTEPPTVLSDGKTNTQGPTAVRSGANGKLLFYSDSNTLYNRFHQPMPNGALLRSKGYGVMALPVDRLQFQLMTTNDTFVLYTTVHMDRRGYTGDAERTVREKALLKEAGVKFAVSCPGLVAVKTRKGNTWMTTRGVTNLLTISNAGTSNEQGINDGGQLKLSHDSQLLANALPGSGGFDLLYFNPSTGQITEGFTVLLPELKNAFGVEFSPDDRFLYVSTYGKPARLWQFDLEAGPDGPSVAASRIRIAESPVAKTFGYLQMAPNGKIYVAMNPDGAGSDALSVIHEPGNKGTLCRFQERGQSLGGGRCYFGLPQFTNGTLQMNPPLRITGPDTICGFPTEASYRFRGTQCDLIYLGVENPLFAYGTTVNNPTLRLSFTQAGLHSIKISVKNDCTEQTATKNILVLDNASPRLSLGPDRILCATGVTVLEATPGFVRYRWNDGTTAPQLTTFSPGRYIVEAWDACGGSQKDTVQIKTEPNTQLNLGPDRRLCRQADNIFLKPAAFARWTWSPEQYLSCDTCTRIIAQPAAPTRYVITTQTSNGCLSSDTLLLTPDTLRSSLTRYVCPNARLPFLNTTLPPDTTAFFSLVGRSGCDSILRVTTLALDTSLRRIQLRGCPGDSLRTGDGFVPTGTTRAFRFKGYNGCDSVVLVEVLPYPAITLALPRDTSVKIGDTLTLRAGAAGGTGALTFSWTPPDHLSCHTCPAPVFRSTAVDSFAYILTARDANGCRQSGTVTVIVNDSCLLYYPNVFTPDGDGVNDQFYLLAFPCVQRIVSFQIYNRWGDVVFSRSDMAPNAPGQGWDGTDASGNPSPTDVFFWMAEAEYYDGKRKRLTGQVTLLR